MKEQTKKVISFLLLLPAFNSRNITSIGLVLIFFLVYRFSGGKIVAMPHVNVDGSFGGALAAPTGKGKDFTLQGDVESKGQPTAGAEPTGSIKIPVSKSPLTTTAPLAQGGAIGTTGTIPSAGIPSQTVTQNTGAAVGAAVPRVTENKLADLQARLSGLHSNAGQPSSAGQPNPAGQPTGAAQLPMKGDTYNAQKH